MTLDLSSLQKAVGSLESAIKVADIMIKGEVNTSGRSYPRRSNSEL